MKITRVAFYFLFALLAAESAKAEDAIVPVVACSGEGMAGPIAAPENAPIRARINFPANLASEVALYVSATSSNGILAVRGWTCSLWSGSNGAGLSVSGDDQSVSEGTMYGLTSGRCGAAHLLGPLFPNAREFVRSVEKLGLCGDQKFASTPYRDQEVAYIGDRLAWYKFPPFTEANPSALPIIGAVGMEGRTNINAVYLSVRLLPSRATLADALVRYYLSHSDLCVDSNFGRCATPDSRAVLSNPTSSACKKFPNLC